jgi:hypothetical protein
MHFCPDRVAKSLVGESVIVACSKLLGRRECELFENIGFDHSTIEGSRPHL